ncbi:MAG: hypothetical protein LBI12_01130, partial [Treponema sp.]|nr:hypothetical protein [Treponema sp.]
MEFINLAPHIVLALPRIADTKGDKYDFMRFNELKCLLNKLEERGKLLPAIDVIAKANENSGLESAALNAKEIIEDLEGL